MLFLKARGSHFGMADQHMSLAGVRHGGVISVLIERHQRVVFVETMQEGGGAAAGGASYSIICPL